jgi:hypothetical protein
MFVVIQYSNESGDYREQEAVYGPFQTLEKAEIARRNLRLKAKDSDYTYEVAEVIDEEGLDEKLVTYTQWYFDTRSCTFCINRQEILLDDYSSELIVADDSTLKINGEVIHFKTLCCYTVQDQLPSQEIIDQALTINQDLVQAVKIHKAQVQLEQEQQQLSEQIRLSEQIQFFVYYFVIDNQNGEVLETSAGIAQKSIHPDDGIVKVHDKFYFEYIVSPVGRNKLRILTTEKIYIHKAKELAVAIQKSEGLM